MAKISEDFKRYLETNYPDDLLKITGGNVKDDIITSIVSRHERTYQIWKMVPEWIKTLYNDRLPPEVFSGQEPWDKFMLNIEQSVMQQIPYDRTKLTSFVYNSIINDPESCHKVSQKMEKGGFMFETAVNMQFNENKRNYLYESGEVNTPEGKKIWRETRISDCKLIENDWKEQQQNKYVLHQIKNYFRAKANFSRVSEAPKEGLTPEEQQQRTLQQVNYTRQAILSKKNYEECIDQIEDNELKQEYIKLMDEVEKGIDRRRVFDKIKKLNIRVNFQPGNDKPQTKEEKQIREMLDETITEKKANNIKEFAIQKTSDAFGIDD